MNTQSSAQPIALELANVTKSFGSFLALSDVSFALRKGTIHALLGENGAGKTTLMRIAYGLLQADRGTVRINGSSVQLKSPSDAIQAWIGMVHQHFMLVPAMTVAENIAIGGHGSFNVEAIDERVRQLAKKTGLQIDPTARVDTLTVAAQQRVEIIKALARNARVLILDEPTAVLAPDETKQLLDQIHTLVSGGLSVVLITHKLDDAKEYADDISVLRHGSAVLHAAASDVSTTELTHAMIGTGVSTNVASPPIREPKQTPAITLRDVHIARKLAPQDLTNVNLEIRGGEVVGIAALNGAATDLIRVLAGRETIKSGETLHPETVAFVPEDRQRDALVLPFKIHENIALKDSGMRRGILRWSELKNKATAIVERADIRARSIDDAVSTLSGGNQQKLVLARELDGRPAALIAENPTRGLDVRAAANVKQTLSDAAASGCAIVLYSSDLDEIVEVANRVLVVRDGSVREVPVSRELIGSALVAD